MRFSLVATALISGQAAAAAIWPAEAHAWCGTPRPTLAQREQAGIFEQAALGGVEAQTEIVVDTYFHCVTNSTSPNDGWLSVPTSYLIPFRDVLVLSSGLG